MRQNDIIRLTWRRWITASCWTFIFLCGIFSTEADAAGGPDSLYAGGMFREAAIGYERVFYESADPVCRAVARLGRAACEKQLGLYEAAVRSLGEIPLAVLPDSLRQRIWYESALNLYLSGRYDAAAALLEQAAFAAGGPEGLPGRAHLLTVLTYNELYQYEKARMAALRWIASMNLPDDMKDSLAGITGSFYAGDKLPRVVPEQRAVWFSRFVPGSGQALAGFPGEGAVNFLLHAAALGVGVLGVLNGYYITGYIIGAGMLQKLYFGGLRRTRQLVREGNALRTGEFNALIRETMISWCR